MAEPSSDDVKSALQGFDALYGLEITDYTDELVRAQVPVRDEIKQPAGLVHGGLYASIAESIASLGTAAVMVPQGNLVMGMSNHTAFLRPITEGTIHAVARRRHRGRTSWMWDVDITDDAGHLCAVSRMTIAVRPMPAANPS